MIHPVTQQARAWKLSVVQGRNDVNEVIKLCGYRHDGEPRTLHVAPVAAAAGRKVRVLKSGTRRIVYK
jgi:hypothetical protein